MYKNELILVQQTRNFAKSKKKYSKEKATQYYSQNKEAIKKVKELMQKLVKRRKRQD